MTTSAITPTLSTRSGLTFGGILRSEWIKLTTLRSTIWCYAIMIVLNIGLGFLFTLAVDVGTAPHDAQQAALLSGTTLGISFSQLVSAVLGALVVTGEYGTGMIRSTLTAVPRRTPALIAKAVVFGATTFVIGLISLVATALLIAPLLAGKGIHADFSDGHNWLVLIGGAGFLALIGLLSLGIGTIIRNSAGGIAASLGLILVVPTIVGIIAGVAKADWAQHVQEYLPSSAGGQMYAAIQAPGSLALEPWQGGLVLLGWVVVTFLIGAILLKRRDA